MISEEEKSDLAKIIPSVSSVADISGCDVGSGGCDGNSSSPCCCHFKINWLWVAVIIVASVYIVKKVK